MDCEALTRDVLRRLGDGTDVPDIHRTWQDQEIQDYIRDGYYELCLRTEALWDQWYLDNLPFAANSNFDWEQGFITSKTLSRDFTHTRGIRYGFSNRQYDWERAWAIGSDNPGNHGSPVEWPYLLTDYCTGVVPLPEHMYQVDRATQNSARVHPTRSSELEYVDPLYEETRGAVDAYSQDKDGARVLRKYKLPSTRASAYTALGYGLPRAVVADENEAGLFEMNLDEWAVSDPPALYTILGLSLFSDFVPYLGVASTGSEWTTLSEFTTCTVLGAWGVARRIPNYHPIYGHLGGIRRFHLETNNFKIEGHRRGHRVDDRSSLFEVPDHYLIYVRHYVMAHALSRDSEKQDPDLARHYQARFEAGVARMKERMERMQSQRLRVLGDSVPQGKIAFAQPPWNLERL